MEKISFFSESNANSVRSSASNRLKNVFTEIEENMVEIAGRMDLCRDALDVLRMLDFLLKFLEVLSYGIGLHPTDFPEIET